MEGMSMEETFIILSLCFWKVSVGTASARKPSHYVPSPHMATFILILVLDSKDTVASLASPTI